MSNTKMPPVKSALLPLVILVLNGFSAAVPLPTLGVCHASAECELKMV
ncbi:MAG: hypothetical protein IJZ72_08565 [Oscillospiraceae bacterium]|nr:hypothetical protein [Oscillospiraceae bacterium]